MTPEYPARLGSYDVLGVLDRGAGGAVYKASQPASNRTVAIKVLPPAPGDDPSRVERFHREAEALARLHHPNIVQVVDKGQDGDVLYFVMEYMEGTSLADRLKHGRLALSDAVHVVAEIAKGLQYAHDRGVHHRDLCPHNVFVSPDLTVVKLGDFGISRPDACQSPDRTMTGRHPGIGGLSYCAPERVVNPSNVDHRADIYSLGVIAYEALTGKVPIGRFSLPSELNRDVPLALDPLVLKCLARDPAQRYGSAAAFLSDLGRVKAVAGVELAGELKRLSLGRLFGAKSANERLGPQRLLWLAVAGTFVVAAVAAGYVLSRRPATPVSQDAVVAAVPQPSQQSRSTVTEPGPAEQAASAASGNTEQGSMKRGAAPAVQQSGAAVVRSPGTAPAATPASASPGATQPPAEAARTATESGGAKAAASAAAALETIRHTGPADKRIGELRAFIVEYGKTPSAPEAFILLARAQEQAGLLQDAIATLGEVMILHKNDPRAAEALYNQAQLMSKTKATPDEVRRRLAQVAADYRESPFFVPAMTAKIALEERLKIREFDAALGTLVPASLVTRRVLVEGAPRSPMAESMLWRLGEMYDELKRHALAAETYAALATRFPSTKFDAWFAAAEIYERRLNDKSAAREAYLKVPVASSHYRDAQSRAAKLAR